MKRLLCLLIAVLALSACDRQAARPLQFKGVDVTGLQYARSFTLTDHNGKLRTLNDFKGKLVLVFFGYTQCPDVCPTTMTEVASALQQLGPRANEVQVLFITIDPERDTQELLRQYVPAFSPTFLGLRGDAAQTAAVAKEFRVFYQKVEGSKPGVYSMNHTSGLFVFDKDGKVRLFETTGQGPAALASDLKQLLG